MKKSIKLMTAFALTFSMLITGCSLNNNDSKEATEYINDENVGTSEDASADALSKIVADDLAEPDFEDPTTDASVAEVSVEEYPIDENLVMVFLGDSQFANGRADGTDIPTLVGYRVPNATVYNLAIGGTTAALDQNSPYLDFANWSSACFLGMAYAISGSSGVDRNKILEAYYPDVLEKMNSFNPADVDYYFIEYGANDFFTKVPLDIYDSEGQPTDINSAYTYYGALNTGITLLKQVSPKAKFVIVYPFYGIYKDSNDVYLGDSYVVSNGIGTLSDYAEKAKNVAETQGAFIFDGMYHTKCDLYLDTQEQYLMDTVHLNETGRRIMARLIAHIPNGVEGYEPKAYREGDFIKIAEYVPDSNYRMDDDSLKTYFPDEYEKYLNGDYILVQPQ